MIYTKEEELFNNNIIVKVNEEIFIENTEKFRKEMADSLAQTIVLGESEYIKKLCYWIIYNAAMQFNIIPSSIQNLYMAQGRVEAGGHSVPAINIRTLTYSLTRAVFRSAKKINAGAFIFEIAKSEIGYTSQRPIEYASYVLLAAIRENYTGPIFLQGDHFQINASNYFKNQEKEISQLKNIIREAIAAGFYNIDIDSSTLVDLTKTDVKQQQKLNYEVCSSFTRFIREIQPRGIEISIGGEIGEVGGKNSTEEELSSFMKGYLENIGGLKGISKMSIQTGSSHGGVILPDGSIAKVKIDFETLKNLSQIAKKNYGLGGCVQHGASTLPNEAFGHFPDAQCLEIHLATQFQNIVYEYMPLPLKEEIYTWLHENCLEEKKEGQTEGQFIYNTRKKALGHFKKQIYSLKQDVKNRISQVMEKEFDFLFDKLKIKNTKDLLAKYIQPLVIKKIKNDFLKEEKEFGSLEGAD